MVVDASVMVAWLINEPELTPGDEVYHLLASEALNAPAHWPVELANALNVNLRRRRIVEQDIRALHQRLSLINIVIAPPPAIAEMIAMLEFASAHRLTVYDAAYVMLARDLEMPLVTLDAEMRAAAHRLNVTLLPP